MSKTPLVYPPKKLRRQWKIPIFNRKYIFQWLMFHCHVSFRGSNSIKKINSKQIFQKIPGQTIQKKSYLFLGILGTLPLLSYRFKSRFIPPRKKVITAGKAQTRLFSFHQNIIPSLPSLKLTSKAPENRLKRPKRKVIGLLTIQFRV